MRKLSLTEFKGFCAEMPVEKYIFNSEDQTDDKAINIEVSLTQAYKRMSIFLAPNAVCFANDKDSRIAFDRAKYVRVPEKINDKSFPVEIVCDNAHNACCDTTYIFVIVLQT